MELLKKVICVFENSKFHGLMSRWYEYRVFSIYRVEMEQFFQDSAHLTKIWFFLFPVIHTSLYL